MFGQHLFTFSLPAIPHGPRDREDINREGALDTTCCNVVNVSGVPLQVGEEEATFNRLCEKLSNMCRQTGPTEDDDRVERFPGTSVLFTMRSMRR